LLFFVLFGGAGTLPISFDRQLRMKAMQEFVGTRKDRTDILNAVEYVERLHHGDRRSAHVKRAGETPALQQRKVE
jgi:hypothetical protein